VFDSINPTTGALIARREADSPVVLEAKLAKASSTFETWRRSSFKERTALLTAISDQLKADRDAIARIMTEEMGKTLASAKAEVEKCAWACRYYAKHAEAQLADEPIETEAKRSFVRHLPLGPVLAVMPWNFPFWQVFRFAAPAIAAGNVGLLKHASNVMGSAIEIERVIRAAGAPEGLFQTLLIGSKDVAGLLADERIKAATLTGSEPAGASVASIAGSHIKPTVLELGGADAFLVMPSAELDKAVEAAVAARMINNGQSCIAAKRFFVHADVYPKFRDAFVARIETLRVGDPMLEATEIGPLATASIRAGVDEQVEASVAMGARRLGKPGIMDGPGFFYRPGVIEEPPAGSPGADDELFGPVASLFKVGSLDEAILRANASRLGLGSAIWTDDEDEIEEAVNRLEAGMTFVNSIVASDPRLPFGGVKSSGYGRELAGDGVRAFVNRKTVSMSGAVIAGTE
jgi:succinate-semialdehyde dehydrogenase/glutarate-semialdehyde dehydrogenase